MENSYQTVCANDPRKEEALMAILAKRQLHKLQAGTHAVDFSQVGEEYFRWERDPMNDTLMKNVEWHDRVRVTLCPLWNNSYSTIRVDCSVTLDVASADQLYDQLSSVDGLTKGQAMVAMRHAGLRIHELKPELGEFHCSNTTAHHRHDLDR